MNDFGLDQACAVIADTLYDVEPLAYNDQEWLSLKQQIANRHPHLLSAMVQADAQSQIAVELGRIAETLEYKPVRGGRQ